MQPRHKPYAELRDDLADDLRRHILIVKPNSRCPNDEEAEAIAKVAIQHFHELSWRADLYEGILKHTTKLYQQKTQYQMNWLRLETAIADLVEAKRNFDDLMKGKGLIE